MRCWIISMLVVLGGSSCVHSQQVGQSSKVSYEGQKVGAVELIADPKISIESLQPLVQQKTGEPYSSHKVEATVFVLRQTSHFTKVTQNFDLASLAGQVSLVANPPPVKGWLTGSS
jgi:outer membrane protein assembly factor BamA